MKNLIIGSIKRTLKYLFLIQSLLVIILLIILRTFEIEYLLFFLLSCIGHILVGYGLIKLSDDFRLTETEEPLTKINIPNLLTLFRLSSLPTISFLLILSRTFSITIFLMIYMAIAFLTDLFDGMISRKTHQITYIGRKLDSASDYMILFAIAIGFAVYKLTPFWMFLLIIFRGLFMVVGVIWLSRICKLEAESSLLGKVSVFAIMTMFGLEILHTLKVPFLILKIFIQSIEYATAVIIIISLGDKFHYFKQKYSEYKKSI
jgi:phosphatidylglycerophosphate synthase